MLQDASRRYRDSCTGCRRGVIPSTRCRSHRATSSTRRESEPTSLRTVLPSVGSPIPSSRCSDSITSMNRSVSATDAALPSSPPCSSRTSASAVSVASTANRPSIVSGTWPSTYQCGARASAVIQRRTSASPRLGSAVNPRNRKPSIVYRQSCAVAHERAYETLARILRQARLGVSRGRSGERFTK